MHTCARYTHTCMHTHTEAHTSYCHFFISSALVLFPSGSVCVEYVLCLCPVQLVSQGESKTQVSDS